MKAMKTTMMVVLSLTALAALSGCGADAIETTRSTLDFGRDNNPQFFDVYNKNSAVGALDVTVETDRDWIRVVPTKVQLQPPQNGRTQNETIEVRLDRNLITRAGENKGNIILSGKGVKTVKVAVVAIQPEIDSKLDPLNIVNPAVSYDPPYLVEFAFSLRDRNDRAVTGEPAQFTLQGFEDDVAVGRSEGLLMQRGAARQLWLELVLDYSDIMRELDGAIPAMEQAVSSTLLPALNADALVAVSAYYRDSEESRLITPYTTDKTYVEGRIAAIQTEILTGFASGARMYDALITAINRFDQAPVSERDDRYVVLFSNGRDTSSRTTLQNVITRATRKGVRIITVGFRDSIDSDALQQLANATRGRYISADSIESLEAAFERIVEDLSGQYIVRWASLRRDNIERRPSIRITYDNATATYASETRFKATNIEGNPLIGKLTMLASETAGRTTVFLRTDYVPRGVDSFWCRVSGEPGFEVSLVDIADDGLMGSWQTPTITEETNEAGDTLYRIDVDSGGVGPIPFASMGAMLRFDFDEYVEAPFPVFEFDAEVWSMP